MISVDEFNSYVAELDSMGYAASDIAWAESVGLPPTPEDFAIETVFIICNSGMRYTVARMIFEKCRDALLAGRSASTAFGHKGKASAMDAVWRDRERLHANFLAAEDRLTWLATLPWVGHITKYHLAKNFGLDVVKPDVHLQRLADIHGTTPQALCEAIAAETGYRVATVDTLLWRACATGVIDSRIGMPPSRG